MPRQATVVCFSVVMLALTAAAPPSTRPTTRPSRATKQETPIKEAINLLADEAQRAITDHKLPHPTADFASRFSHQITKEEILAALTQPTHKEPFIDAYIRWQLTSFNPTFPALDDNQFLKLMTGAPAMVANPRAEAETVDIFEKAEKAGKLPPQQIMRLRDDAIRLERRTQMAQSFNLPAEGYRDWIASKLPEAGPRRLQWLIERCAATIQAGWPSRTIKTKLGKEFKAAAGDSTISVQDRWLIEKQARRLIGLKRRAINEITFPANGTVDVTFTVPAVDEDDVEKWTRFLNAGRAQ